MADARDLLTLAEAKRILRLSPGDASQDLELEAYVTAASRAMDSHFGNTVALSVTGEVHDGTNRSGRGYRHVIVLRHRPVTAVASVVEHRAGSPLTLAGETATGQPTDAYLADRYEPDPTLYSGFLRRRASGQDAWFDYGRGNIAVTYTAGRVASTAAVDPRFKRACGLILANLWRDREPGLETQGEFDVPRQSYPTFAIPNAAKQLLSEEWGQHEVHGVA